MRIVAVFVIGWWALATSAFAVTWDVPGDAPSIAAALASASPGDTVLVAAGTWTEHSLLMPEGVTLRGAGGTPAAVVLDAAGLGRVLNAVGVAAVRVENLTIRRGVATSGSFFSNAGGGMRCDSSEVVLADCIVRDNRAIFGAGVAARGSEITIERCRFEADSALSPLWAAGGGLYVQGCIGSVTLSAFERNAAFGLSPPGDGGAVFADESEIAFADCSFANNAAGAGAGGVYSFFRDQTSLVRCTFTENDAPAGGAMYIENSYTSISECSFLENTAHNGGALFIGESSRPFIDDSLFESNVASPNAGGAVDCWISDPVFTRCAFRENSATRGGAIAVHGLSGYDLVDCWLDQNVATLNGGALRGEGTSQGAVVRCTFSNNSAVGGGAISVIQDALVSASATLVAFSSSGGAVTCGGFSTVTFTGSDIFGNVGGNWTGCIAAQSGIASNFSADPMFCPSGGATLSLPDSPCLPQNSPSGAMVGAFGAGCGCPAGATILVPAEYATIAAAIAAASPGDVVGVCSGEYAENVEMKNGVHVVGVRPDLARIFPGAPGDALVRAAHVSDSTMIRGLTLDADGAAGHVVRAESLSVGLHLANCVVTGATSYGIVNGPDSRIRIGGALGLANDIFDNAGVLMRNVQNLNVAADSLDATRNYWGTHAYDQILASIAGKVRSCPITNLAHSEEFCGSLAALDTPATVASRSTWLRAAPNPFRAETVVSWAGLPSAPSSIRVYDVRGRLVATLSGMSADRGAAVWEGVDDEGRPVMPGVYFLRLEAKGLKLTEKTVRLR